MRLTFGDDAGFAALSPDGGRVVYGFLAPTDLSGLRGKLANQLDRPQRGGLRVQSTAGGNVVKITESPDSRPDWQPDWRPDWSPDGNSIAFVRPGEGILIASQLGGQERRVAPFGDWPRWSPDGSQILFSTDAFGPKIRLFLATPDQPLNQAPHQILTSFLEGGNWQPPAWHPDGRITITGRHRTEGFGTYTISLQDGRWVKTAVPSALLKESNIEPELIWTWGWAPSAHFLYASCVAGGVMNIWRLRMDASLRVIGLDRLTNGPGADWAASVSGDGRKLQFTTIAGNSRLWSFPIEPDRGSVSGEGQPLSERDGEVNWASLSADGRRLAYIYTPLNAGLQQSELRLLSFPFTGPPQTVPAGRYARMASAWSHRGDRLALQGAELSGTGSIVATLLIVREPNGTERAVARCEGTAQAPPCSIVPLDWTPDDSAVLASSRLRDDKVARLSLWPTSVTAPSASPRDVLVADDEWNVLQARYSPDGKWLAFAYGGRELGEEKGIATIPASGHVPRESWRSIADRFESLGNPRWSPNGGTLYFTAATLLPRRPGLWRVAIAPSTGAQVGVPTGVNQADGKQFWILARSYYPTIAVGTDRVVLPLNSQQTAVWMLDNVDR